MKSIWNNPEFLRDTFGHNLPPGLKEQTVARMIGARRHACRSHRILKGSAAILLLVLASAPFLRTSKEIPSAPKIPAASARQIPPWQIHSTSFAAIVRSQSLPESLIVHTEQTPTYDRLTDDQLFDLFRGRPLALVKRADRTEIEILDQ